MAKVKFTCKLELVTLEGRGTQYYQSYCDERWEELKTILTEFGITFPSKYEVDFNDEEYRLKSIPGCLGDDSVRILYKDTDIAKAFISGSNYCDREGRLNIDMDCLKAIYKAK